MAGSDAIVEGGVINGKGNGLVGTREKKKSVKKMKNFNWPSACSRIACSRMYRAVPGLRNCPDRKNSIGYKSSRLPGPNWFFVKFFSLLLCDTSDHPPHHQPAAFTIPIPFR